MNRLLRADFSRLFKRKLFWAEALFMIAYSIMNIFTSLMDGKQYGVVYYTEGNLFAGGMLGAFCMMVLVPFFIGAEYSDKTIRNKLIVGHGKEKVFLSNVITMLAAGGILLTLWNISFLTMGSLLLGFKNSFLEDALLCIEVYLALFTVIVLFVIVSMFITSRYVSVTVGIGIFLFLFIYSISTIERLKAQEYLVEYFTQDGEYVNLDDGIIIAGDDSEAFFSSLVKKEVQNPSYISDGFGREALKTYLKVSPVAQLVGLCGYFETGFVWYIVSDNILILLLTFGGAWIYRRKEIS